MNNKVSDILHKYAFSETFLEDFRGWAINNSPPGMYPALEATLDAGTVRLMVTVLGEDRKIYDYGGMPNYAYSRQGEEELLRRIKEMSIIEKDLLGIEEEKL